MRDEIYYGGIPFSQIPVSFIHIFLFFISSTKRGKNEKDL